MKPGFYFDPDQITDDDNEDEYYKWASKVKGRCALCKADIYNYQDTITLIDEKTNTAIALLHSNAICWRKWKEENIIIKK